MGHNDKDCRAYQLLKDRTVDTYLMKGDEHIQYDREMCSLIIGIFLMEYFYRKKEIKKIYKYKKGGKVNKMW